MGSDGAIMNNQDREWLIRIDERTLNIWRVLDEQDDSITKKIDKIIDHQEAQNGAITKNTVWRKALCWIMPTLWAVIISWLLILTF